MTPDRTTRELLEALDAEHELHDFGAGNAESRILGELSDAWRAAESEAEAAYETWRRSPGPDAYVVYRAAEDRAHAAQESMRAWTQTRLAWARAATPSPAAA